MDLAFRVPMQDCCLQRRTLLPLPVTSKTGCCFCFDSISSFFLELFLHSHRKLTKQITWTTVLSNSMKLWATPCRATQDARVMVESSDKTWSTGEGNGKPVQNSCLENPMNSMKRHKDRILKDELPRSVVAQYVTGDQWRNSSKKNEETEPKKNNTQLWMWLVMEVKSDAVKSNIV